MSFGKSFATALHRSVDAIKSSTAHALRMKVTPSAASEGPLGIWSIRSREDLREYATGCDKDIGGLSTAQLDVDGDAGRFWGTLSNQVPRGARIEKTGYAGMRNKNRPTLFGLQTWDTSLYPFLALRLRNRVAHVSPSSPPPSSLLAQTDEHFAHLSAEDQAKISLGYGIDEPLGPRYFVNIQTDGPVTSDLFQHRLWFDPALGDDWQTVVIPLDRFLLLNTGTLSSHQIAMMRQAIRTIGISCTLETPRLPASASSSSSPGAAASPAPTEANANSSPAQRQQSTGAPSALRGAARAPTSSEAEAGVEEDWASDGKLQTGTTASTASPSILRGSKRGQSFRFDLGIAGVQAVGSVEEAHELTW
ncbi:unnamed protein product [Parajaminaea phylloscopi]